VYLVWPSSIAFWPASQMCLGVGKSGSPAEKAGLQGGDRLIEIDGQPIRTLEDFVTVLRAHAVGELRWDVVLSDGPRLMLPERDPVPALRRIVAADSEQAILARDVTHIDLRVPNRATLRLSETGVLGLAALRDRAIERYKATTGAGDG